MKQLDWIIVIVAVVLAGIAIGVSAGTARQPVKPADPEKVVTTAPKLPEATVTYTDGLAGGGGAGGAMGRGGMAGGFPGARGPMGGPPTGSMPPMGRMGMPGGAPPAAGGGMQVGTSRASAEGGK